MASSHCIGAPVLYKILEFSLNLHPSKEIRSKIYFLFFIFQLNKAIRKKGVFFGRVIKTRGTVIKKKKKLGGFPKLKTKRELEGNH